MRQGFRYFDSNDNEVATVQYWHIDGVPVSPIDPKAITVGVQRYVIFHDDLAANPENCYKQVWQRKIYGLYMKVKCFVFGPEVRVARAA